MNRINKIKPPLMLLILINVIIHKNPVYPNEIHVAVASNFTKTIKTIVTKYQLKTSNTVILAFGSTGTHYLQIKNGAPFDIFFAADAQRPKMLENMGLAQKNSRFTYAIGKVVLWIPQTNNFDVGWDVLSKDDYLPKIAIANPKFAPYGKAAVEIMKSLGVWEKLKGKVIRGNNINQTYNFIKSGNADMGFISYAQIKNNNYNVIGHYLEPKNSIYNKIEQQAVLLKNNQTARDFISFIKSQEAIEIIKENGYESP